MKTKPLTIDYAKGWSTHIPVLIKLFGITDGPIMEIGTGVYSTPILHWLCHPTKRKLVSYENNADFIALAKEYKSSYHLIKYIDDYRNIIADCHYSIILIDHAEHYRGETAVNLSHSADYIVLHDADRVRKNAYHLIPAAFQYYRNYEFVQPWTGVASNFKPLDALW